jgi:AAA family ATP:ADP antiporter
MLVGTAILVAQLMLTNYVNHRAGAQAKVPGAAATAPPPKTSGTNAFSLVLQTRYLLLMGLMLMLLNWVNTTGEYILGSIVKDTVSQTIASGQAAGSAKDS